MAQINGHEVLAFNLLSREEYIAGLKMNIEEWKSLQYKHSTSEAAIRNYGELVFLARKELERLGA